RLRRSADKKELVAAVRDFAARLRGDSRLVNLVGGVADELLMNALYNAPYDDAGAFRFRHLERSASVELGAHEEVEFSFASDGHFLAVGCCDPFGSLSPNLVQERLATCFEESRADISNSSGGAGLGLFMIYNNVGKLVVNLQPGRCTEFIGIFDLRATGRERKNRIRGLNIFVLRD
ncbi:MAG: hypothetical protein JXR83_00765, partial [Deltaproteobacteria bacterium]|nr:hypothetical protein [Deltaproteobacteria bacterium]